MAKERVEDERARDLTLAWTMAMLQRQKTIPRLETLLSRQGTPQSTDQQRSALAVLSEQYGIPMRKTRLVKRGE